MKPADGEWALLGSRAAVGDIAAEQAFAAGIKIGITIVRYDGLLVELSVDPSCTTAEKAIVTSGEFAFHRIGGESDTHWYDADKHCVFVVGFAPSIELVVGAYVKVTGLIQNEHLNGMVGPVVRASEEGYDVSLPKGCFRFRRENLLLHTEAVTVPHHATILDPTATLATLGLGAGARLLWLEKPESGDRSPCHSSHSATTREIRNPSLMHLKWQFQAMDLAQDGRVSAGELRSFLWNLRLGEEEFRSVQSRFIPEGNGEEQARWAHPAGGLCFCKKGEPKYCRSIQQGSRHLASCHRKSRYGRRVEHTELSGFMGDEIRLLPS